MIDPSKTAALRPTGFAVNLILGAPPELRSLEVLGRVIGHCMANPEAPRVFVSVYVSGSDPQHRRFAVRMANEAGADIVSICDVATIAEVEELVDESFCPLVLGGGLFPTLNDNEFLAGIRAAKTMGIGGLCIGARVWKSADPKDMIERLRHSLDINARG